MSGPCTLRWHGTKWECSTSVTKTTCVSPFPVALLHLGGSKPRRKENSHMCKVEIMWGCYFSITASWSLSGCFVVILCVFNVWTGLLFAANLLLLNCDATLEAWCVNHLVCRMFMTVLLTFQRYSVCSDGRERKLRIQQSRSNQELIMDAMICSLGWFWFLIVQLVLPANTDCCHIWFSIQELHTLLQIPTKICSSWELNQIFIEKELVKPADFHQAALG